MKVLYFLQHFTLSQYYNSYEEIEQLSFEAVVDNDFEIKTIIDLL